MFADYYSQELDKTITYQKKYGENFPSIIEEGGAIYKRIYTPLIIDVGIGFCGNAKDGYKGDKVTYNPAKFTPMNKIAHFGKAGRTAGVECE